jgi:hypothetical protein
MYPYSKQDVENIVMDALENWGSLVLETSMKGAVEDVVDALERHGVVEYLYTVSAS